ncbi:FtsX-like permease family protein [Phaeobacter porticola]|uniref:Putative lipoprotein transport protein n=1 Tax=Phaeobacter porticola TaxID=1844006 RepID=A0A1L3I4K1_9RHOB|nr:FtsX-like permease family protein [Phaeobacter porticola]APG47041.1 putative lipoprotein transport protein [Phaeobacter porticola]
MIRPALGAILSHWRQHPLQLGMLITGLALATALWSAVQAINGEARASYADAAAQISPSGQSYLAPQQGYITISQYVALRRAGWQLSPVLTGSYRGPDNGPDGASLELIGIDILSNPVMARLTDDFNKQSRGPDSGNKMIDLTPEDLLLRPGRLFVHPETNIAVGGTDVPPVMRSTLVPLGAAISDIATVAKLLQRPNAISRLILLPDQPAGLTPLADLAPNLRQQTPSTGADTAQLTRSFHLNLTAFGLLSFAVGLFIVQGTIALGIEQRRGMFRTLRSLGLPLKALVYIVFAELLAITIVAALLGLLLGYLVAAALLPGVGATLSGLYGASLEGSLQLRLSWVVSGMAMALAGMGLAGAQSWFSLYHLPILAAPAATARGQQALRGHKVSALAGAAMLVSAPCVPLLFDGLLAGFVFLGGLMLGAALLLPLVLSGLAGVGTRLARTPVSLWLWADMRAQLPGLSLALMALLLALATNIGVGTMVSSFRLTFLGWLDQRLASELYMTLPRNEMAADVLPWLASRDIRALPIRHSDERYDGAPMEVYGIINDATYRDNWPLLRADPDVWQSVDAGTGVLINEQLSHRAALAPGDPLQIAPGWQMPIAGVYSDYGNPHPQAIVGLPVLLRHRPQIDNRRFGLRVRPSAVGQLRADLTARFDLPSGVFINQGELKARSLAIFDRTFVVTAALNLLTFGVAGFAILTSLLTLWSQRLPQLAPIWAMGLTRRQLARYEVLRSVLLSGLTALLALPLGLLLGWALLAVVNVEAFGWRLPMVLFPLDWLRLFLMALAAAALAAALPARRLSRLKPADLLRVFANER